MSGLLNSIFFLKPQYLNLQSVLNILRSFMFTKANQISILSRSLLRIQDKPSVCENSGVVPNSDSVCENSNSIVINTIEEIEKEQVESNPKNNISDLITPKQADTLFWCLFIAHFGYGEYIEVDRNYGIKELEIKKQIGDFISKNPHKMKNTNVKLTKIAVQEILSELLTSQKDTSMHCLMALLVYYNINVILVNSTKLLMLEYIANVHENENEIEDEDCDTSTTYVLYKDAYNKYSVQTEPLTVAEIADMKEKMICLESHNKPLKAISHYKVDELEELAKKMGILDTKKKYKKAELYQEIVDALREPGFLSDGVAVIR
jgi:hypothetical protein